jgi:hypothetical protein
MSASNNFVSGEFPGVQSEQCAEHGFRYIPLGKDHSVLMTTPINTHITNSTTERKVGTRLRWHRLLLEY